MNQLCNSLVIFDFLKEKFERDLYLMEFSVSSTKKYGKRCKELTHFNEDLKQSLFLKQIIDVCSFLDEFNAFRSLAKDCERVKNICKQVKPALKRIEEVKGLRAYRNTLAAHNFRHERKNEDVVLISDYSKHPDCPNSIAEMFFLSSLCITIIEAISGAFNSERKQSLESYISRLEDDRNTPLRGVKTLREAYDQVEKYRIELNLQPKFLENEFTEFNMALGKLNWSVIPEDFQLLEDRTNKAWCEVLDLYLRMRGYKDIKYFQGEKGCYINHWLELYGYAITFTDKLDAFKPSGIKKHYDSITTWDPHDEDVYSQKARLVYDEIMKVVVA
jgi:hypothetical protein